MRRRWLGATASVAAALAVVACSGGDDSADVATLPVEPTVATTVTVPATEVSATAAVTTAVATTAAETAGTGAPTTTGVVESTATTAVPDGFVGLSADGPWKLVDSAPGVDSPGLVYELMPKLWAFLPTEEVPDDGNLFVPQPQDVPIIEAYLQAKLVYFRAASQDPIDLDDPGWTEFFGDQGDGYREVLEPKRSQGQHADLDLGVVLRPYVIGEQRTESFAIVFDCVLDGGVFVMPDGSLAPGSSRGVGESGGGAPVRWTGTRWLVDRVGEQAEACV